MPIDKSWKSMVKGMKGTYCKKKDKAKCRDFTDGSKVCLCKKAWSVFFATMRKHGWKEGSPRSKKVSETVFKIAIEETVAEIIEWYEAKVCPKGKKPVKKKGKGKLDYSKIVDMRLAARTGKDKKKKKRKRKVKKKR